MPTVYPLIPDPVSSFLDNNGDLASGYKLFVYAAGTSSKATTYQTSAGSTANANPIVLDSRGEPPAGVYVESGSYKLVYAPANDTDPPTSPVYTRDNVPALNDISQTTSQFVASGFTPTYISATSFSVEGDRRSSFEVGRRLETTNTGGTGHHTVASAAYGSVTTVTVTNDSLALDAGLSAVSVGILRADASAIPHAQVTSAAVDFDAGKLRVSNRLPGRVVGEYIKSASRTAPYGTLTPDGSAVSRTTYADLYAELNEIQNGTTTSGSAVVTGLTDTSAIEVGDFVSGTGIAAATTVSSVDSGTQITLSANATASGTVEIVVSPYGIGDGSTTFNLPDRRGRVGVMQDNQGGSAANRVTTSGAGGYNGARLGETGGDQEHGLTATENGPHEHSDVDAFNKDGSVGGTGGSAFYNVTGIVTGSSGNGTPHENMQPFIVERVYLVY